MGMVLKPVTIFAHTEDFTLWRKAYMVTISHVRQYNHINATCTCIYCRGFCESIIAADVTPTHAHAGLSFNACAPRYAMR